MKELSLNEITENQNKIANKNVVKTEVKAQVKTQVMMFNDQGIRIIPGQVEEEVVKTNVTKVNFKSANMNITSVTHVDQESEFLM